MYKKILVSFVSIFFMVACNVGNTTNNNLADGTIITKKNLGIFPANALSYQGNYEFTIDDIQYVSDGLNVNGFIAYPVKTNSTKKLSSVLYLRGGNNIPNNQLNVLTAANIHRFIGFLAANGYTVIAPNYRGSPTSQGKDEYGGEELHDSVNLIYILLRKMKELILKQNMNLLISLPI